MNVQGKLFMVLGFAAMLAWAALPGARALAAQQSTQAAQQNAQSAQQAQPAEPSTQGQASQSAQASPAGQSSQSAGQPAPSLRNAQGAQGAQTPQAPPPPQISPEERQAYETIVKELDPAKQLAEVKAFEKAYPKSVLLSDVYFFAANAEEQQNDAKDALSYGQKSLQLQPNNLRSLILVAGLLPLPQVLQGTTEQQEQQLTMSENDANQALQLLAKLPPPSSETPDQFAKGKQLVIAQLHAALGMAHLQKAVLVPKPPDATELAAAEQEYKSAVSIPQPDPRDYYRLGEVYTRENKLDDAVSAFTQCAQLGKGTLLENYANSMIKRIKAAQAKQGAPASPPANP